MRELEQTVQNSGMEPGVIEAIRELHERLAQIPFDPADGATVTALIHRAIDVAFPATELTSAGIDPKIHL